MNSSFNVFESPFNVFEPTFNVFEPPFSVFERRFLLGSKTFLFSISNKKSDEKVWNSHQKTLPLFPILTPN